ncbi:MAG: hypothetical protein IPP74_13950 [Alphaproteobacteria bacterium]|nr:hypothetical protein [Alphaproteobacteria bacterium]
MSEAPAYGAIIIGAKPEIDISEYEAGYHTYIIAQFSDGSRYILRAGPEGRNVLSGDVFVVGADSLVPYNFNTDTIHHDWYDVNDSPSTNYYQTQITGTGAEIMALFNLMRAKGSEINDHGYDYEVFGNNCNSAVFELIKPAGLVPVLPDVTIHGDHLNEYGTKEIIGYRFKRGVLGWGGYRVQI